MSGKKGLQPGRAGAKKKNLPRRREDAEKQWGQVFYFLSRCLVNGPKGEGVNIYIPAFNRFGTSLAN